MSRTITESLAVKTKEYLAKTFPNVKLVCDQKLNLKDTTDVGFKAMPIHIKKNGSEVRFKTDIIRLNQYLA